MDQVCVIGDVNVDVVSKLTESLKPNSDTQTSNSINLGGSPCNMAMWLSHLGIPVEFLAAIGDDLFGTWINQELNQGGVFLNHLQIHSSQKSGSCIILVDQNGQRTMFPDPGANLLYSLDQKARDYIASCSVVVMSAYSFLRPQTRQLALEVVEIVNNCNARLVIDAASSAPIQTAGIKIVQEYLTNADLILANSDEFELLSDEKWLANVSDLVVKQGSKGSYWLRFGQKVGFAPAKNVEVIDTTGAGDSYLAGLVSVLIQHNDWFAISDQDRIGALVRATEVAAMNIVSVGAGPK